MEIKAFEQRSQVAGTVVRDKKGEIWKVLKDIPYVGFKLNQPFESEYYEKVTPIDVEKLAIAINESISELKKLISGLDSRIKLLEPEAEISMSTDDFTLVADAVTGKNILKIKR